MKNITTLLVSLFYVACAFCQNHKFKKADELFYDLAYTQAAEEYEYQIAKIDKEVSAEVLGRIGDCYFFNTDMASANRWYKEVLNKEPNNIDPEYMFRYAHTLEGIGKYDEAKTWMKKFAKKTNKNDIRKEEFGQKNETIESVLALPPKYELKNLSINTEYSDFGVGYFGDKVVFASASTKKNNNEVDLYPWNDQPYLNLYSANVDSKNNNLYDVNLFSDVINTKYHEASAVFTKDLKKVYFTRNNFQKKLKTDDNGVNHLKLYSADLISKNGILKLGNVKELPFNNDNYSVGHPALSKDNKTLYFVSDMPGSIGGTDIFKVSILEGEKYSKPKNLGPIINTSGREMFPYVENGTLYFASDGHLGLGGLDVFESRKRNNKFAMPVNLGAPLNSSKDDFAFVFKTNESMGYVSSNRSGGSGDDDIYAISLVDGVAKNTGSCKQFINGYVSNNVTGERIENAQVSLFDKADNRIAQIPTNLNGEYKFENLLECSANYKVLVDKQGYNQKSKQTVTSNTSGITEVPLGIETVDKLIVEEKGLLKIKIGIIYFDLDKDFIRTDASMELNKIVLLMSQYPKMHIKIESHTDSRNDDEYNRQLSDKRAKSTRDYLISQGIEASRIVDATGYGESRLVNNCGNGVPCNEGLHQLNRRSEFIITKM